MRKVKTDPIDANRIAQVYYLNSPQPHLPLPEFISDLRNLCRQYDSFNTMYTETQVRFRCLLDLIFPNYDTVFTHVCCKSSLKLLSSYPSPKSILSADRKNLIEIIKTTARGHSLAWVQDKVDKLLVAARESLPSNDAQQSSLRVVKDFIKILMTHQDIMDDLRAHIIEQASISPAYLLLRSIPGVGELTAAIILSEVGDVLRFPSAKQLVAFSGLDPSVFESGKFKSTNNKVSKRGSPYLRTALYQATVAGIAKRKGGPINPVLFEFYSKKTSEGKSSKVAIVATCNKLLRIIYSVWKSKQPFVNDH